MSTFTFIIGSNAEAYLNMADFSVTSTWTREFAAPAAEVKGIDYALNTDYFLHNAYSSLTI
jgi:hypothetical protein